MDTTTNQYDIPRSHTVPLPIKLLFNIFMWLPLFISFITIYYIPRITIIYNILILLYIIITGAFIYASCFISLIKQKNIIFRFFSNLQWKIIKEIFTENPNPELRGSVADILHIVIIAVYKEDPSVLENNLISLAKQNVPMIVGLALEERDIDSNIKYDFIIRKYEHYFIKIIKTIHPMNIPNEIQCKGANCNYCARMLVKMYEENRLNLTKCYDYVMITVSDCDSIWSNDYFLYLNYLSTKNNLENFHRIAYAPNISYLKYFHMNHIYSNWVSITRSIGINGRSYFFGYIRNFMSEYHIPLDLLKKIDYWDSDLVHEDIHMRNKLAILDGTSVIFKQTYLACDNQTPTSINSLVESFCLIWNQTLRWNFFLYDMYYLFYELLLNIFKRKRYENFRTNPWKILIQLILNYEHVFFSVMCILSNNIFWILYFRLWNQQYYKEIVEYLQYGFVPCFCIIQTMLTILYVAFSFHSNDESTQGIPYNWKKQIGFLLGLTIFPYFFLIHQLLSLIVAWIQTLKGVGVHSDSASKYVFEAVDIVIQN